MSQAVKAIFILLIIYTTTEVQINGQDKSNEETDGIPFAFDEIPVFVIVEGYKNFYVDAIYANNDLLYINVNELFKEIGIQCVMSHNGDGISGFIGNENRKYSIDFNSGEILTGTKTINAKKGMLKENETLYLESSLFSQVFGMTLTFNFRALTLILKSDFELPVIKQLRLEKMRNNLSKIKGEQIADTIIKRNYHIFRFGTLDWSAASYQTWKDATDNRFGLGVGAELFKGEADVSVNYYSLYKWDNRNLNYIWRWVDNKKKLIKQAEVGKISNQSISFINSPIVGAVLRNSPTTLRKATGFYTINEFTEPNWTVELYINNVMVDYTKSDASGMFMFKVPIVYGYTTLKLMFYGPLGEERTEERTKNVPYTVMPKGEFEYSLAAGIAEDGSSSVYSRGEGNYGINSILTVGVGVEYLSSIPNGAVIPFAKATIQPFSKLLLSAEYDYGVKTSALLDFYFLKNALLELDYSKFVEGQLATRFNALEERKVKLSVPFKVKKTMWFSRLDYSQFLYGTFNYDQANLMFSVYYKQFSANSSTHANWIDNQDPFIITDLALSYRFGKGFTFRPSAQYNVTDRMLRSYKLTLEKSIPKGYITFVYERNILFNDHFLNLNFRYDLPFARTSLSASHSNGKMYTSQSAQGSLAFGSGNKYVHTSYNSSVSRGGISLYPFLDINNNGVFDKGEHMVKLNTVKVSGSKAIFIDKDSIVRIADLNSFISYTVEFNDNDLENLAWRFKHKTYSVLVDPNQFKRVDIPIVSVGEASGMVYRSSDNSLKGLGRILVKFYGKNSNKLVAETLSESDGYVYYLGLAPGEYVAMVDSVQLSNLDFKTDPVQREFTIKTSEQGDIVSGIDFVMTRKEKIEIKK